MAEDTEYDIEDLASAYYEAKGDSPFVAWSLFADAYGDNAERHFMEALNNGDIEVYEKKHGILLDGSWPRYNIGRLWLEFDY